MKLKKKKKKNGWQTILQLWLNKKWEGVKLWRSHYSWFLCEHFLYEPRLEEMPKERKRETEGEKKIEEGMMWRKL